MIKYVLTSKTVLEGSWLQKSIAGLNWQSISANNHFLFSVKSRIKKGAEDTVKSERLFKVVLLRRSKLSEKKEGML